MKEFRMDENERVFLDGMEIFPVHSVSIQVTGGPATVILSIPVNRVIMDGYTYPFNATEKELDAMKETDRLERLKKRKRSLLKYALKYPIPSPDNPQDCVNYVREVREANEIL